MNTVWLKRLTGMAGVGLTSLVGLAGCHNDDCDKPKRDCDDVHVSVTESKYRSVNASATVVTPNTWNTEEQYWRTNYSTRPYASVELNYDEFAPAYRYGYDMRTRHAGQSFRDVEKDLARDWESTRGTSKLSWEQARPAVRDSWDRDETRLSIRAGEFRVGVNAETRPSWDADDQYWRTNYSTRPYVATGGTYDDYNPAYHYGYESRAKYQGKRFDDVEADLGRGWESAKGTSKLDWEKARAATRDSWDRDESRLNVRAGVNGVGVNVGTGFESDDQYWRTNYSTRPYFSAGTTYDDYSPAYRYGYESRSKYQGKRFDDVEADLSRGWDSAKSNSKLGWEKAKAASRDAWDRADHAVKGDRR